MNSNPINFRKFIIDMDLNSAFQVAFNKLLRQEGKRMTSFAYGAHEEYKKKTGKFFCDEEFQDAYEEIFCFKIPLFSGDREVSIINGAKYSVYRVVINDQKKYFDSFVPLEQFVFRGRTPWSYLEILSINNDELESLINFSNSKENNLVAINRIESDYKTYLMIRMNYLDDKKGMPLVPETTSFTDENKIKKQAEVFNRLVEDSEALAKIYDSAVYLIKNMPEKTGYRLTDISLNNIIASHELDEFTFIDVLDIKRKRKKVQHDMASMFSITQERIAPKFLENLSDNARILFPTYEFKNNPDNKEALEAFKDNLFIKMKRPRFVEGY
jgi:hypothetical protein